MTQQFKGSASTSFWFLALTGCLLLWCSATNAQKAMKGEPANEAEQIARALDGLKGADGSSIRAVADLGTSYLNSRRYAEAEALSGAQLSGWILARKIILNCSVHHSGRLPGEEVDA